MSRNLLYPTQNDALGRHLIPGVQPVFKRQVIQPSVPGGDGVFQPLHEEVMAVQVMLR